MTLPMIIALAVTAFMIYLIMTDKVPFGAAPLIACALMVLFGVTDIPTAFRGFSNSSIIMLASFMAVIAALQKTSFIAAFKNAIVKMAAKGGYKAYVLIILVAIPLPGTGAWTGALVAAMLDMQLKRAFPAIAAGVVTAGLIVTIATYGVSVLI